MRNYSIDFTDIITKATTEAGLRSNELYTVEIISKEERFTGFVIETEWNVITCFADTATGAIIGLLAEPKSCDVIIEKLTPEYRPTKKVA